MATQPTNLPVPSESPRDLKFNAGKIDEFVTSMGWTYTDRFGQKHYTIEGINYLSQQAMAAYGYVILTGKTFTTGATLNNPNEVLLNTADGEYYKWTGSFASGGKVVPENSTPAGTGGIGPGAWIGVGDASLRAALAAPGGVDLVNGAAKQTDLDALSDHVDDVENSIYYRGKTAATLGKSLQAGTVLNIKCFGDSTMWGAIPGNLATQSANNPPKMLKEALLNLSGISNNVTNHAISGTTLYDMMRGTDGSGKTFLQRLKESPCDIVYCNHGINDNQTGKDILTYRTDLMDFINQARGNNSIPVLVTATPNAPVILGTTNNSKSLPLYVKVMREVAIDMAVDIVDQYKYFEASTNVISPEVSFPDGVHLSDAAYRQAGYNLAIPLITCHTITHDGDTAGLDGVTWYTNSNNYEVSNKGARCGSTFSWNREASITGINYPVILGTGKKVVSFNILQWTSAGRGFAYVNSALARPLFQQKQYGGNNSSWDSEAKIHREMYAGLNVYGLLMDITTTSYGNGLTFSGVFIPKEYETKISVDGGYNYSGSVYDVGDQCIFSYNFSDGVEVVLVDKGNEKVISIKLSSGSFRAGLYKENVEQAGLNLGSSIGNGIYQVIITFFHDGIQINIGSLQGSLVTQTTIPNVAVGTPNIASFLVVSNI